MGVYLNSEMNEEVVSQLEKVVEVSGYLWEKGWIERNGGNLSVNLTGLQDFSSTSFEQKPRHIPCTLPEEAAGMVLFVTCSGERLRELASKIEKVALVIRICSGGQGYEILHGGIESSLPTSELDSHVYLHLENSRIDVHNRCLLHCHPTELLALSYHPQLQNEQELNRALWSMLPEVRLFVPKGVGLLPYAMPGSKKLAVLSRNGLKKHDVLLWSKHGSLAMGSDMVEAFDYIDVANKGAQVLLKCLAAGYFPEGLSDNQLRELEEHFLLHNN